jgi:hypothetical protein
LNGLMIASTFFMGPALPHHKRPGAIRRALPALVKHEPCHLLRRSQAKASPNRAARKQAFLPKM